jgi:hypothetical protein
MTLLQFKITEPFLAGEVIHVIQDPSPVAGVSIRTTTTIEPMQQPQLRLQLLSAVVVVRMIGTRIPMLLRMMMTMTMPMLLVLPFCNWSNKQTKRRSHRNVNDPICTMKSSPNNVPFNSLLV